MFERANLISLCMYRTQSRVSLINPDWNFQEMGIGGLDDVREN